jgi:diguanylate cyclase (GGDEF)-like protein
MASMTSTKRALVGLSHALERSVRPGSRTEDRLVLGLFQRREYFDVERDRYAALAAAGAVCIVGFVGGVSGLPHGVHAIALDPDEALAVEWSLVVLDDLVGSALVALGSGSLTPGEPTLEAGREFHARWTFQPHGAAVEAERILDGLAGRLLPEVVARARVIVADGLARVADPAVAALAEVTQRLVVEVDRAHQRASRIHGELERSQYLAEVDQLTGLHNRHFLERFLGTPVLESPVSLAALLIDLDGLKAINDTHGHAAGDAAIRAAADCIRSQTRDCDLLCRLGGDEFLVLMPGLAAEAGLGVATRVATAISVVAPKPPWESLRLSASIGVAMAEPQHLPMERLDEALYRVKRTGKGRALLLPD